MRRILLIAKRDYLAAVRSRAFIIGLVVFPIVFGGGSVLANLMRGKSGGKSHTIAILDHTGKAGPDMIQAAREINQDVRFDKTTGLEVNPLYEFKSIAPDPEHAQAQLLALSDQLRRDELFAVIDVPAEALHPPLKKPSPIGYYANGGGIDATRGWIDDAVNNGLQRTRLTEAGIPGSRDRDILAAVPMQTMKLITRDPKTGAISQPGKRGAAESFFLPFALAILLAMIVMISIGPVLSSVAEDKLQRVFEMLLGAATPFELMGGKVLAAVGQSLTSSIFYIIGGLLVLQGMALFGLAPLGLIPWFFVYLIAEVTMLCAMGCALGAACGSPRDAQQLAMLVFAPIFVPLMLMGPIMMQPNGPLATGLSLFPPSTPVVMLLRQSMPGGVPAWQPWVGLFGMIVMTPLLTWAAARIFRIAILVQGQRPSFGQLVRWAAEG